MRPRVAAAGPSLLLVCLTAVGCGGASVEPAPPPETAFLNQDPSVGYVGIAECRPCHLGIASTYSATGMGRSLYPLTAERVVEDFSDENEFVTSTGARYRMLERDGKYYQRQYVRDSSGREVAAQEHELVWAIGSNNHNRGYIVEVDGRLFQAPVCWYPQSSRWDLCPGYELKNDHFSREISTSCVFCHNGVMQLEAGERNRFRQPFPHGIGCERCHGPGRLHAERWAGRPATSARGEPDPTIVNPRRLPTEQRLDLCFQCHLGDAMATERVQRRGRDLHAFRPGQPLSEIVVPFRFSQPTRHDFGLSAQGDRLLLSRCFTESDGGLDCLTCHNPHISVYHEERPDDLFRRKCLGCHAEENCAEEHGARAATATPDDCVACHMRRAEPDDQRFTEFTDHWIRRRIDDDERDRRESFAIEPVLERYAQGIDAGELAYYRARAAYLMGEDLPPAARAALWTTAIEEFQAAIAAGHDTAEVRFYLGKTYMHQGRWQEADAELQEAVARDAQHRDATFALGQSLAAAGDADGARRRFAALLEDRPNDPAALAEYARTAWALGQRDEALAAYERALAGEPTSATLHLNRGATLASLGRFSEAFEAGLEAARYDPDSAEIWQFLVNAAREAGLPEHAREAEWILRSLTAGRGG